MSETTERPKLSHKEEIELRKFALQNSKVFNVHSCGLVEDLPSAEKTFNFLAYGEIPKSDA
ncbi:hypothetical protein VB796_06440 [Arcicella sp. LKC2W]|uniref:hypothetical protein n=1 Tax=Arcicella sp. LKC2W TaxID=2984198 RepID=UPI002B1F75BB|nr:hypothetical protein [Arcicella sp. LKC2W]MEA5458665.1 hypothetical protein [Arcicella sp. LKC2W]